MTEPGKDMKSLIEEIAKALVDEHSRCEEGPAPRT